MSREKDTFGKAEEHNSRGIELADKGWLDEATSEFKKAIACDPNSSPAWDNLATVYSDQSKYREALDAYLQSLRIAPENPTGHYNLACFLQMHALEFSVSEFEQTLKIAPDYPDAHLSLGIALADMGRNDLAMRELKTAVTQDPEDILARNELANQFIEIHDYREAIFQLKEVTRIEPEHFESWLDLGVCYAQKGFYSEAEKAYARAAALNGNEILVHYNLAALYAQWQRPAEAIAALDRANAIDKAKVMQWLRVDPMFDSLKGLSDFEVFRGN